MKWENKYVVFDFAIQQHMHYSRCCILQTIFFIRFAIRKHTLCIIFCNHLIF